MFCAHPKIIAGVTHCCERERGHEGDHLFAFTAGQLNALQYTLQHPRIPSFPGEAILLFFSAIGVELFAAHHSALDWGVSLVMIATAIRWIRQWQEERRRS
jgi:hypothetical protein